MAPESPAALSRLSMHTRSTAAWSLEEAFAQYSELGISQVALWHPQVAELGLKATKELLGDAGLRVTSLTSTQGLVATGGLEREAARTTVRKQIDDAAMLGAPVLLLVGGASPEVELAMARQQIIDAIHAIAPHAKEAKVKLAIEPLHPMYAESLSAINTLDQANNLVLALDNEQVGVAIDVYHLWWDAFLRAEIERASGTILVFQVSDWRTPAGDIDADRAVMGEGCIPLRQIREWVERAGYQGPIEIEAPSMRSWEGELTRFLRRLRNAFEKHC